MSHDTALGETTLLVNELGFNPKDLQNKQVASYRLPVRSMKHLLIPTGI